MFDRGANTQEYRRLIRSICGTSNAFERTLPVKSRCCMLWTSGKLIARHFGIDGDINVWWNTKKSMFQMSIKSNVPKAASKPRVASQPHRLRNDTSYAQAHITSYDYGPMQYGVALPQTRGVQYIHPPQLPQMPQPQQRYEYVHPLVAARSHGGQPSQVRNTRNARPAGRNARNARNARNTRNARPAGRDTRNTRKTPQWLPEPVTLNGVIHTTMESLADARKPPPLALPATSAAPVVDIPEPQVVHVADTAVPDVPDVPVEKNKTVSTTTDRTVDRTTGTWGDDSD